MFRMHSAGQEVALEDWWKRAGAERSGCMLGDGLAAVGKGIDEQWS